MDLNLHQDKVNELWQILKTYVDIFVWHKGELGCCIVGEHMNDTQGLPRYHISPNKLSFWEEAKVN